MKLISVLALVASLFCLPVNAAPDEHTKALMNQSPTMLDWGLLRLNDALATSVKHNFSKTTFPNNRIRASYNWDDDEIRISVTPDDTFNRPLENRAAASANCELKFLLIRLWAAVDSSTGEPLLGQFSYYTKYFMHLQMYDDPSRFETQENVKAARGMDKKFTLSAEVFFENKESRYSNKSSIICEAPLLSNSFSETLMK